MSYTYCKGWVLKFPTLCHHTTHIIGPFAPGRNGVTGSPRLTPELEKHTDKTSLWRHDKGGGFLHHPLAVLHHVALHHVLPAQSLTHEALSFGYELQNVFNIRDTF